MIDDGRRGREAVVDPELTRREVVARVVFGEYKTISVIHDIVDHAVDDVTEAILAEAVLKHDPEKCEAVFRKDHAQTKS